MNNKMLQILFAVLLCLAVPSVLAGLVTNGDNPDDESVETQIPLSDVTNVHSHESVRVLNAENGVTEMNLDSYLLGVLLQEMPGDFELEALKAQAVVARTYALMRNLKGDKHSAKAVCTDSACCQGYCQVQDYLASGGDAKTVEKMNKAVQDTKDLVLSYSGELIEATYFSCSGGKTEDAQAVWGSDIPYLQSVDSPGEENATHYTDTMRFTAEKFQQLLGDQLLGQPGTWIKSITYTEGGGVDTIKIGNVTYSGTKIRSLLNLPSTAFVVSAVGDNIIITTKGFGHRVGMSQYGADAMAVSGSSFEEILYYYYNGTQLGKWDDFV